MASVRFWLRKGSEEKLKGLCQTGKLGEIEVKTDKETTLPYVVVHYDDDPLLDIFPTRLTRKVTVRDTIDNFVSFVTDGIYREGEVEIVARRVAKQHSNPYGSDVVYFQDLLMTGPSWHQIKRVFHKLMKGDLKPAENWDRRYREDQRDDEPRQ